VALGIGATSGFSSSGPQREERSGDASVSGFQDQGDDLGLNLYTTAVPSIFIRAGLSKNYDTPLKDMTRYYGKRSFLKPHRILTNFDHSRRAPLDQVRNVKNISFNDFWSFLFMDEWLSWRMGLLYECGKHHGVYHRIIGHL
jgi:hypothetical protein